MTRPPRFVRLYRALLLLYPAAFRSEFSRDVEMEFRRSLEATTDRRARLRIWTHALRDLAASVPREHLDRWIELGKGWDMGAMVEDLTRVARGLVRAPGVPAVATLTLALGIGATTAIFSVVHGVLLAPLPYPDPDRIVTVNETFENDDRLVSNSYVNAMDWKAAQTTLEALAMTRGGALTLMTDDGAQQLSALFVDSEFFDIVGAGAGVGRLFGAEDNRVPGGHPVAVLTPSAWERLFGADPDIVGRVLSLSGTPFTVVGVLSPGFRDPFLGANGGRNDLIVPAMMVGQIDPRGAATLTERRVRSFGGLAKLRPGVTIEQAQADLQRIAERLQEVSPINRGMSVGVVPFTQSVTAAIRGPAVALLGGALVLLLIACFNVANILLVRGASREHELAVQLALGAGRGRLARLLTLESVLLAVVGGGLGVIVTYVALPSLIGLLPAQLPPTSDVRVSLPVLAAGLAVSLLAGLGAGLFPALRIGAGGARACLPTMSRTIGHRRPARIRNGLVVFEVATATILLASATLLVGSFRELASADPGFVTEHVLTMQLSLPLAAYEDDPSMATAAERVAESVEAVPGVLWATPWGPGRPGSTFSFQTSVPDGMVTEEIRDAPLARRHSVTPGALDNLGLELLRGRSIEEADEAEAPRVVVISQSMAEALWPGADPLGRRYHNYQPPRGAIPENRHWTVVGVVADAEHGGRVPVPGGIMTEYDSYFPFAQRPERTFTLLVQTVEQPSIAPIRDAIRAVDPNIPIFGVATMGELFAEEEAPPRFAAHLMGAFGLSALLLAALGIYGVLSFSVSQRLRELGLRTALGASAGGTLARILGDGLRLTGVGLALGTGAAYVATRGLRAVMPNMPDMDGAALAVAAGALSVVAVASCLLPAIRATRVAPLVAIKGE